MALFQTVQEIQQFLPVSNTFAPQGLLDAVDIALEQKIAPLISRNQVQFSVYTSPNTQDPVFLKTLKRAAAHFAFLQCLPFLNVMIGNTGIQIFKGKDSTPAKPEDIERIRLQSQETAWDSIETLLSIMADHPDHANYSHWRNSPEHTINTSSFIVSAADFSRFEFIGNGQRVYARLRPSIKHIEENEIYPVLTDSFAETLKESRSTPANRVLLSKYVKSALAKLALADALPGLAMTFGYDSILTFDNAGANYSRGNRTSPLEMLLVWQNKLESDGRGLLEKIRPFLAENAADYPGSPQPTPGVSTRIDRSKFTHNTLF